MMRWPFILYTRMDDSSMKLFLNFIKIFNLFREKREKKSKMTISLSDTRKKETASNWLRWWWSYARDSLTISASNQMEIAAHRVDDIFYAQRLSVTLNAIRKIIKSDSAFLKWKAIFIFLAPCSPILSIRLHSFITEFECTKIHSKRTPNER